MDGTDSPPRSYLLDRLAAGLISLGYVALLAVSLRAQGDLAQKFARYSDHYPSVDAMSVLIGLGGLGRLLFAAFALAKGRRWAFAYLFLYEAPRLLNVGGTLWTVRREFPQDFTVTFPIRAAIALSIGVLAYSLVRGTGSIGPRPTTGRTLPPLAWDRGVGLAAVFVALASSAWALRSTWNWTHGPDISVLTALSAYADVVFLMVTAVWVSLSLAKGQRWAFVMTLLSGLSFLLRASQWNFDIPVMIEAILRFLLFAYGVYRLWLDFAAWTRPRLNPWPEREDDPIS